jgi:hypothetical protein
MIEMRYLIPFFAVLLVFTGCSNSERKSPKLEPKKNHVLEFEYLGEAPCLDDSVEPCKIYLMTHTSLDSGQDIRVRRRYVTVCNSASVSVAMSEYDVKIR